MINLTIDVGNTRTKVLLFEDDKIVNKEVIAYLTIPYLKKLPYNHKNANCIISVTGKLTSDIEQYLVQKFKTKYIRLTHDVPMPIKNLYRTPETLGRDRLAGVVGAYALFPEQNCLVIDAGTCITYDLINNKGEYLGGNIAPGVKMRLLAMNAFTAKLPIVEMSDTESWIGYDTNSALVNGGQLGTILEVRSFISRCRRKFGQLNVIFTGGDTDFFVKQLKSKIFARPNLISIGLNQILKYNVE